MKCYADSDFFKIYMSDTGLLSNLYGLDMSVCIKDEYAIFKGGLTENYVAQQLKTKGMMPVTMNQMVLRKLIS